MRSEATLEMYDNGTACLLFTDDKGDTHIAFAGPADFVRQMAVQFGYTVTKTVHKTISK